MAHMSFSFASPARQAGCLRAAEMRCRQLSRKRRHEICAVGNLRDAIAICTLHSRWCQLHRGLGWQWCSSRTPSASAVNQDIRLCLRAAGKTVRHGKRGAGH